MGIMEDLRNDLTSGSANLSNTLRKARVLASQLKLPDFQQWVKYELSGYSEIDSLPDYRIFTATNLGLFSGPFGSQQKNVVLPIYNLPDFVREFAENLVFFESVGSLEGLLSQESNRRQRRWPQEFVLLARESIQTSPGWVLVDACQPVPDYTIAGILDNVKNKLLDFILDLEDFGVTPERIDEGLLQSDTARNLFRINIYGDHNVVASGESVHQQRVTVRHGDVTSLISYLRSLDVSLRDLGEIEEAVNSEPQVSGESFGSKVSAWIGQMVSKAASGLWSVGIQSASTLLNDALRKYYGI